jgi:hypothetical protein
MQDLQDLAARAIFPAFCTAVRSAFDELIIHSLPRYSLGSARHRDFSASKAKVDSDSHALVMATSCGFVLILPLSIAWIPS